MNVTTVLGIIISIVASIGIAYGTEKERPALAGISGFLNVIPVFMNAPAGLLMPLEVVQTLTFHLMQCGRESAGPELPWLRRAWRHDKRAHAVMALLVAVGIACCVESPRSIRHTQIWKRVSDESGKAPDALYVPVPADQLASFDNGNAEVATVDLREHNVIAKALQEGVVLQWRRVGTLRPARDAAFEVQNAALSSALSETRFFTAEEWLAFGVAQPADARLFVKATNDQYYEPDVDSTARIAVGGASYHRMTSEEASERRWSKKAWFVVTSWALTVLHAAWTGYMVLRGVKLDKGASLLWILMATLGAGVLVHVHAGTFFQVLMDNIDPGRTFTSPWTRNMHVTLDLRSIASIFFGCWWFVVCLIFVAKGTHVHEIVKTFMPVMFICLTAINGMYYNDEVLATPNNPPIPYVACLSALIVLMLVYAFVKKPTPVKTEADLRLPAWKGLKASLSRRRETYPPVDVGDVVFQIDKGVSSAPRRSPPRRRPSPPRRSRRSKP